MSLSHPKPSVKPKEKALNKSNNIIAKAMGSSLEHTGVDPLS